MFIMNRLGVVTCIFTTGERVRTVLVVHQRLLDVEHMCPMIDLSYWRLPEPMDRQSLREWVPFEKKLKPRPIAISMDEKELKLWDETLCYFGKKTIQPGSVEKMWPGISSPIKEMKLVRCFRRVALYCLYCDTSRNRKPPIEKLSIEEELCCQCRRASPNLKRCGGCLIAQYCSAECQKLGWAAHKSTCKKGAQKSRNEGKLKGERCSFCETAKENLQTCSRCGKTKYCDKKCQRSHWVVHKSVCHTVP